MTAPPFILSPVSLTEFPGMSLPHPSCLLALIRDSVLVRTPRVVLRHCRCKDGRGEGIGRPQVVYCVFMGPLRV